jgi:galactokinase
MIGNIFNHLYNGGEIDNVEIAKISQYAENVFFGKPSGLMDQMACAVGGAVYIDFADCEGPLIERVDFPLSDFGYALCIVNTGGNHADLNDDYASVPSEMRRVAEILGRGRLCGLSEGEILSHAAQIRESLGDRALMRAIHFVRECRRVGEGVAAIRRADINAFFALTCESGHSSYEYLQNVYTTINVAEQGLSLALALTDGYLSSRSGAYRVHGGGFAGTIQAFVKTSDMPEYVSLMDSVFGKGAAMALNIRPLGATRLF